MDDLLPDSVEELIDLDNETKNNSHQTPEKHLDSPITTSLLERLTHFSEEMTKTFPTVPAYGRSFDRVTKAQQLLNNNPQWSFSSFRRHMLSYVGILNLTRGPPTILDARMYPSLFNVKTVVSGNVKSYDQATEIYELECQAYVRQLKDVLTHREILKVKEKLAVPPYHVEMLHDSHSTMTFWSNIVEQYRKRYGKPQRIRRYQYDDLGVFFGEGFIVLEFNKKTLLASYEQLQMIQDVCTARHNVYVALNIGFHNGTPRLHEYVKEIIEWQEEVLISAGNKGYEIVKAPEAIFKAWLTKLSDGDVLPYSSYHRTLDKIRERELKYAGTSHLTERLDDLVQTVTNIHDAAELFGLTKLSGHPTVYAALSAQSIREEATASTIISPVAVRQTVRYARHLILSGYIRQHQAWPPFICEPQEGTVLRRFYVNRVTSLPLGSYPIDDIDAIIFGKFIEYDYSEDYLKFLDDKAICPGGTEMSKFWFGGQSDSPRRLLKAVLQMDEFDLRGVVERMRKGQFYRDELVVELTQKEKEFKERARSFGKLPFAVRTFFTLNEFNIKEKFMKLYLPHQTMTMSNAQQKRRLYDLVRNPNKKGRVLVEADFSRWNLKMCHATVAPVAFELECIFGMPGVFSQIHRFFEASTFVLTDKHSLPTGADPNIPIHLWPTSDLVWRGHTGGVEGLGQGMWSFFTIAMAYYGLEDIEVSFNIAAQGDNVVFAFDFDTGRGDIAVQLRSLLVSLEVRCTKLNHTVKPEECIDSRTVLTYGKEIYVNGAHVLYNLKFASKSFKREDTDIPSINTEIATMNAIAMQCADSVYLTMKACWWRSFLVLRCLRERCAHTAHVSERRRIQPLLGTQDGRMFLVALPGSLGGLPNLPWTRFFMKGEVDDLSWDVAGVLLLRSPILSSDLHHTVLGHHSPKNPRLTSLLQDPHSIPLNRPADLTVLLKRAVAEALPAHTKNKYMSEILKAGAVNTGSELATLLTTARPFFPQILSDILKLAPSGVHEALLGRFIMTRTISRIVDPKAFTAAIHIGNRELLRFISHRHSLAKERPLPAPTGRPFDVCTKLRHLWGDHVEHRNIGVYTPFDFSLSSGAQTDGISAICRSSCDHDILTKPGKYPPNFGTQTRAKKTDHGVKIVSSSSTISDLKKLTMIHSELGSSDTLALALNSISKSRSPWPIDRLCTVLPTSYGGSALHRHEDINSAAFAVLGSKTVPTSINFCSDHAGILSGGQFDIPIAFQAFYLTLTCIIQTLALCECDVSNCELQFDVPPDLVVLPDEPVEVEKRQLPPWPNFKGNPLMYVSTLQAKEIAIPPDRRYIPHVSVSGIRTRELIYSSLLNNFSAKYVSVISRGIINKPIDLFDLKEFNHCPTPDMLAACSWFILAVSLAVCTESEKGLNAARLHETLLHVAAPLGALLGRLFVHMSNSNSSYVTRAGIVLLPGESGALNAAARVAGLLVRRAYEALESGELLLLRTRLVVFEDVGVKLPNVLYYHSLLMLISQRVSPSLYLSPYKKRLLLEATKRFSYVDSSGLIRQTQKIYKELSSRSPAGENINLEIVYTSTSAQLALRGLRLRKPNTYGIDKHQLPTVRLDTIQRVTWEISSSDGFTPQLCACSEHPIRTREDKVQEIRVRPYGRYASAYSVWVMILSKWSKYVRTKHVICAGVGHGTTAAVCVQLGATICEGIDRRESFPAVTQREGTYVPPEVTRLGRHVFRWHAHVLRYGGDLAYPDIDLRSDCVIIDIEQKFDQYMDILRNLKLTSSVILRISCCVEQLSWLISATTPTEVYCLSNILSTTNAYAILYSTPPVFPLKGNALKCNILTIPRFSPSWGVVKTDDMLQRVNDRLLPVGCEMKELSHKETKRVYQEITRNSLNTDDPSLRYTHAKIQTLLECALHLKNSDEVEPSLLLALGSFRRVDNWTDK
jgi:hypothetical protein